MRRLPLRANDFLLFAHDFASYDYEFMSRHESAFRRMWRDQGTIFWKQFIRCFKEYSIYNGVFKDFPPKSVAKKINVKEFIDGSIKYLEEEFVNGKESNAKALVMNCAFLAANKDSTANFGTGFAKDPFYVKETRDVFRTMLGDPNDGMTYMRGYFYLPLFVKFGGAVAKILRVWLEAPEVWDVTTYLSDLEQHLSESIFENEQRKREESERKAQERREKKKGPQDKDATQRERKGQASTAPSATSDGDVSSKSKAKTKKKKKQSTESEAVADAEGGLDELKQKENGKSPQGVPEEEEQSSEQAAAEVNLEKASSDSKKEEMKMDPLVDEEDECIAPTARLFKDWRPPSPEPDDTVSESPFWKNDLEQPQFPFLGFHRDPDELDMKTLDMSADSKSPCELAALPKVLLEDVIASSQSETELLEGTELSDRQEAQEKPLELSDCCEETVSDLSHVETVEHGIDSNEQMIDGDLDDSMVEKGEDSSLESAKVPQYKEEIQQQDNYEGIAFKTQSPSDGSEEQQSEAATISNSQSSSEEKAAMVTEKDLPPAVPYVPAEVPAELPVELPLVCSVMFVKRIDYEGPGQDKNVNLGGGCNVQELILEMQRGEENTYLVTSQAKNNGVNLVATYLSSTTSGHKYHGTFMTPRGGRLHVSRDLVEFVGNRPRYSFEFCLEMPIGMMPTGSYDDGGHGPNAPQGPDSDVTANISDIVKYATALAGVDAQRIGTKLLSSTLDEDDSDDEEVEASGGHQFVDKLVHSIIESFTAIGAVKTETKKQRKVKVNFKGLRKATERARDVARSAVKGNSDAVKASRGTVEVTRSAVQASGDAAKVTEDCVQTNGDYLATSAVSAETSRVKIESSSSSESSTKKSTESLEMGCDKKTSPEPGKVVETGKDTATGISKEQASLSTTSAVETVTKQKKQAVAARSKRDEPILNEFSGGAAWIKSFCKGEPISKFDGHFRQSVFLRNITPEQLLGRMKVKPQETVPKRPFPTLTEAKMSDSVVRDLLKKTIGGVFFVTRLGSYSLLKAPKWASYYAAYVCSHSCHADKETWKAHPATWETAEKRLILPSERDEQEVTGEYYNSVFSTYDHLNISVLYCYLDWRLEMIPDLQLPRDASKISAMRYIFMSPRGNDHTLDFIKKFMKVGEPKIVDTLLFPTHAVASKHGGKLEPLPVDNVERPSVISAYSVVRTSGDPNLLELMQEKMVEMAASSTTLAEGIDLGQLKMAKDSLPKGAMEILKSGIGRQILSGLFSAVMKKKPLAIASSTEKKTGTKRKGKGKRLAEKVEPTEQLRTCSCCGKEETSPRSFKKCKLCMDRLTAKYYCSRECQAQDWKDKHRLDHSSSK